MASIILLKVESKHTEVDMVTLNVLLTCCCFKWTLCRVGEGIQTLYMIYEVIIPTCFFHTWINKMFSDENKIFFVTLSTKWSYLLKIFAKQCSQWVLTGPSPRPFLMHQLCWCCCVRGSAVTSQPHRAPDGASVSERGLWWFLCGSSDLILSQ